MIPHASPEAINLIQKLLAYDPEERISARQTLHHPYFRPLLEMEKERKHNMQGHGHSSHVHEAKVAPHPQPAAAPSDSKPKQKTTQSNPRAAAKGADEQGHTQSHMHAGGTGKAVYGATQTGIKDNSLPHISKTQEVRFHRSFHHVQPFFILAVLLLAEQQVYFHGRIAAGCEQAEEKKEYQSYYSARGGIPSPNR